MDLLVLLLTLPRKYDLYKYGKVYGRHICSMKLFIKQPLPQGLTAKCRKVRGKLCIKVGGGGMGGCYQIEINNLGKNIV